MLFRSAFIEIGPDTPFVGDKLADSGLRRDYGVSVSSIQRGEDYLPLPGKDARIFPGDVLGVIGSDEQLRALNRDLEEARQNALAMPTHRQERVVLSSVVLSEKSPIVGIPLAETDLLHDFGSMIVKVKRGERFFDPDPELVLLPGDTIWVVGDPSFVPKLK